MKRWLRFSAVGIMGAGVQLAALAVLLRFGVHYLLATALALETAVLHNYVWHCRWTWAGERGSLWRFHVSNGILALASNLLLMRLIAGTMRVPPLPANLAAIALTSFANFFMASRWVFVSGRARAIM